MRTGGGDKRRGTRRQLLDTLSLRCYSSLYFFDMDAFYVDPCHDFMTSTCYAKL